MRIGVGSYGTQPSVSQLPTEAQGERLVKGEAAVLKTANIDAIIKAFDLPDTPQTRELLSNMLSGGVPATKDNYSALSQIMERFEGLTAEQAVFMARESIPINPQTIRQFHEFLEHKNLIGSQLEGILNVLESETGEQSQQSQAAAKTPVPVTGGGTENAGALPNQAQDTGGQSRPVQRGANTVTAQQIVYETQPDSIHEQPSQQPASQSAAPVQGEAVTVYAPNTEVFETTQNPQNLKNTQNSGTAVTTEHQTPVEPQNTESNNVNYTREGGEASQPVSADRGQSVTSAPVQNGTYEAETTASTANHQTENQSPVDNRTSANTAANTPRQAGEAPDLPQPVQTGQTQGTQEMPADTRTAEVKDGAPEVKPQDVETAPPPENVPEEAEQSERKLIASLFKKVDPERAKTLPREMNSRLLLEELNDVIESIKQKMPEMSQEKQAAVGRAVAELEQNVNFLNKLSQYTPVVNVPLQWGNDRTTAELYVFNDSKNGKRIDPQNATVFISLMTANAGRVETMIKVIGKNVECDFSLEISETAELIRGNMTDLSELLDNQGYRLARSSAAPKEKASDIFDVNKIRDANSRKYFFDRTV